MLSRSAILHWMSVRGRDDGGPYIDIEPFDQRRVGPNSVDLHLGHTMLRYLATDSPVIDPSDPPETREIPLDDRGGWVISPGKLYIGVTLERTECVGFVPRVDGRSSLGRLGVSIHQTAGCGDNGFRGRWTLEISSLIPVRLRPGDRIMQVYFEPCTNEHGELDTENLYAPKSIAGTHSYQDSERPRGASPIRNLYSEP